jgi:dihydrolipoamide dehydrogenase
MQKFDIAVIGSGPGGYPAAIRAASRGKKVALIEAEDIGGTCLNRGCIPSKALISGAAEYHRLQQLSPFGIEVGNFSINYEKLVQHKDQIVAKIRKSLEGLLGAFGITIIRGKASFTSPKTLQVTGATSDTIEAEKIIIASGSEARALTPFPFDGRKIVDSTVLLELKQLPRSLAIIGGGVIGSEFASLFSLLGVKVTIFEMLPSLLPMECPTVSSALARAFNKRGVHIETSCTVEKASAQGEGVEILWGKGEKLQADLLLVAVGRSMNFEGLNLDKAGVKLTSAVQVEVNDKMETSAPGIYAIGDIASPWWLAHVATHQGMVAADNACGIEAAMHYEAVPNVIFTDPEIATVGYSLDSAKQKGFDAVRAQFPFQALGKAQATLHTEGFAQVVVEPSTGRILGAQVVGDGASILIAEMALAIQNELTIECITHTIHAHPTMAEGWLEAAFIATGLPLHMPPQTKPLQPNLAAQAKR